MQPLNVEILQKGKTKTKMKSAYRKFTKNK